MSAVRNAKSRAKDFYDGGPKGRGRRAKSVRSRFVLFAIAALGIYVAGAVEVRFGIFLVANALPTVNGPERSVSRDSEAAAKRTDTAEASMTRCWRQFKRA
jgi:hypothetical protein